MSVTIREVAREAGVSIATVSRVINKSGPVRTDTRVRIEEIARRLNYVPSGTARSLITSRTNTLGVLLPDLYGEFFSEVIRGIDQTARHNKYHVLVSSSHSAKGEVEAALRAMRGRVDGLVAMSPGWDVDALRANLPSGLPVVLLNAHQNDNSFSSFNMDNYGGTYRMVQHLQEHGHRRIALIAGPDRNFDAVERTQGYRGAMAEIGVTDTSDLEFAGDFTERTGYLSALKLLSVEPRPTAVFVANDSMAIGALSALREAGLELPKEMAVAGFDDIPMSRYMSPSLTTVHVPMNELGERAMEELLLAIHTDSSYQTKQIVIPARMVIRASCGCSS